MYQANTNTHTATENKCISTNYQDAINTADVYAGKKKKYIYIYIASDHRKRSLKHWSQWTQIKKLPIIHLLRHLYSYQEPNCTI